MSTANRIRADTHVHFHACFAEDAFLDAAAKALFDVDSGSRTHAVLCLTESQDSDWFSRLVQMEDGAIVGSSTWCVSRTAENNSIVVKNDLELELTIIAGRQIVCEEGLEVLALGYRSQIDDGQGIRFVMRHVADEGAIPVLPWGFGKWLGGRGAVVKDIIEYPPCQFAIGDNGGRLAMFSEPNLFQRARDRNIEILPGTDPFPFRWDSQRVGSFGIEWEGPFDARNPFASLKALIFNQHAPGRPFGRLESVPSFVRNQVAIQLRRFAHR